MEQETKKPRKPRKKRKMTAIVKYLNEPSEQAIRDFNNIFYEIILELRENKSKSQ